MLPIKISTKVKNALKNNLPIVAIESTIFAHGLPYPTNYQCAKEVENTIIDNGAIPAITIIDDGFINIGINEKLLKKITHNKNVEKVSSRDISTTLFKKNCGATTVAGTIICASLANIDLMVTGGIGGIHRDFDQSHDMSADLIEISRNKVSVVCSGIKSILDVPRTLEHLETLGIPIISYQTEFFPSFYSTNSGISSSYNAKTYNEIALIIKYHNFLNRGIIVANPPPEDSAIDSKKVNEWTILAQKEATNMQISGKKITPYILKRLRELSQNKTLDVNIDLIIENAKLAALIALSKKNI